METEGIIVYEVSKRMEAMDVGRLATAFKVARGGVRALSLLDKYEVAMRHAVARSAKWMNPEEGAMDYEPGEVVLCKNVIIPRVDDKAPMGEWAVDFHLASDGKIGMFAVRMDGVTDEILNFNEGVTKADGIQFRDACDQQAAEMFVQMMWSDVTENGITTFYLHH